MSLTPRATRRATASVVATALLATVVATVAGIAQASTPPTVGLAASTSGGGWTVGSDGSVSGFGGAVAYGSLAGTTLAKPAVGIAAAPDGRGYWIALGNGTVAPFGTAANYGSAATSGVAAIAATPSGKGYWLVTTKGTVLPFGDARRYTNNAVRIGQPVVGMAPTADGLGYWLAGAGGAVYPYGDAARLGSATLGGTQRVVDIAAAPGGGGYWLVTSTGGVQAFGTAPALGSVSFVPAGLAPSPTTPGYWVASTSGTVLALGQVLRITTPPTTTSTTTSPTTSTTSTTAPPAPASPSPAPAPAVVATAVSTQPPVSQQFALTLPSPVTAGTLLLATVEGQNESFTVPAGWTAVATANNPNGQSQTVFDMVAGSATPASVAVPVTGSPSQTTGIVLAISGADPGAPVDAAATVPGSSGATIGGSLTTVTPNDLVVGLEGASLLTADTVTVVGRPNGFTAYADVMAQNGWRQGSAGGAVQGQPGPSGSLTWTLSEPALASLVLVAVKPAAAAPALTSSMHLIFDDEFNGSALSSTWSNCWWYSLNGCSNGTSEGEWYQPQNISVANGNLVLTARNQTVTGKDMSTGAPKTYNYTSGMVTSQGAFSFSYGYVEWRAQIPKGQGFWPALWLMPEDGSWPPELDALEAVSNTTNVAYFTWHPGPTTPGGAIPPSQGGWFNSPVDLSTGYHTYGADWEPDHITWYVDGQPSFTVTGAIDGRAMYLVMNLAVGGTWPGWPDATTPFPSSLNIDYVRVWQH